MLFCESAELLCSKLRHLMNCFKAAPNSSRLSCDQEDEDGIRNSSIVEVENSNMFSRTEQTSKSFSYRTKLTNPLSLFTKTLISSKGLSARISTKSESNSNGHPAARPFGSLVSLPSKADLAMSENEKMNELQFQLRQFKPQQPKANVPSSSPRQDANNYLAPPEIKRSYSHGGTLDDEAAIPFRRAIQSNNGDRSPEEHRRFAIPSGESDIFLPKQLSLDLPPCPEAEGYKVPRGLLWSDSSEMDYQNTKQNGSGSRQQSYEGPDDSEFGVSNRSTVNSIKSNYNESKLKKHPCSYIKNTNISPSTYKSLQTISSTNSYGADNAVDESGANITHQAPQQYKALGGDSEFQFQNSAIPQHMTPSSSQPVYSTLDRVKNTKNEPVYEHYKTLPSISSSPKSSSPRSLGAGVPSPLSTHRSTPVPPLPTSKSTHRSLPPLPQSPMKPPVPPKPRTLCSPTPSQSNGFELPSVSENEYL